VAYISNSSLDIGERRARYPIRVLFIGRGTDLMWRASTEAMRTILAIFGCWLAAGVASGCGNQGDSVSSLVGASPNLGGWSVRVKVEPSRIGRIRFAATPLVRPGVGSTAGAWAEGEIVIRNTGSGPVSFTLGRTAAMLSPGRSLLATDEGCEYGSGGGSGVCLMYLDAFTLPPGGSAKRSVTLYRDLAGMDPLAAGSYVFRKSIRIVAGATPPTVVGGDAVQLRLTYTVQLAAR
jgi:hypothetical protein